MLRPYTFTVPGNGIINPGMDGDYIRVKSSSVPFKFETGNGDEFELVEGEAAEVMRFKSVRIINTDAAAQNITIYVGNEGEKIGSLKVSGAVEVTSTNNSLAMGQGRVTVSNNNLVLLPAKSDRKYLLIQNNDTAQVLRVNLSGSVAGVAVGLRIGPGESLELPSYCTSSAINVCLEGASAQANNVEWVEG